MTISGAGLHRGKAAFQGALLLPSVPLLSWSEGNPAAVGVGVPGLAMFCVPAAGPAPEHVPCFTPQVLGLLVWSLIAATTYHLHAAYGWVMFVSLFFWILTLLFFVTYLLQLHQKFYMIPWPLVVRSQKGVRGDPKRETSWKDSLGRLQALLGLWNKVPCTLHSDIVSFCSSIA